jgi:hypothetical protein
MGTGRTDEFRKEAVRITTVVANALRTTTRKLRTATACSRPWVARATAMTTPLSRRSSRPSRRSWSGAGIGKPIAKPKPATYGYIDGFYNPRRRRSALGGKTPLPSNTT